MEINPFGLQQILCGLCSFPCFSSSSLFAKGANVFLKHSCHRAGVECRGDRCYTPERAGLF